MFSRINRYLDTRKEHAFILLRIIIGWRLIDGTQDNILSWGRMLEFRDFLAHHGVAYPLVAAHVSVYAQFVAGVLLICGAFTRIASFVMVINFITALFIAHIGLSFEQSFDALMMLFGNAFFVIAGAGKFSVDEWLHHKRRK